MCIQSTNETIVNVLENGHSFGFINFILSEIKQKGKCKWKCTDIKQIECTEWVKCLNRKQSSLRASSKLKVTFSFQACSSSKSKEMYVNKLTETIEANTPVFSSQRCGEFKTHCDLLKATLSCT